MKEMKTLLGDYYDMEEIDRLQQAFNLLAYQPRSTDSTERNIHVGVDTTLGKWELLSIDFVNNEYYYNRITICIWESDPTYALFGMELKGLWPFNNENITQIDVIPIPLLPKDFSHGI